MQPEILRLTDACTGDICFRILHPSGLEIRVAEMPEFSSACAQFGTRFGAVHRCFTECGKPGITEMPAGIAHYLEHKLFENEDGDAMRLFAKLGAADNAYTDFDRTVYHFRTQQHFVEALEVLLSFVQTPYFTQEGVDRERSIIMQELLEALDDPADQVFQQLLSGLYHALPLTPDILGTQESILQITPEQLRRCHALFYNLHNTVLCCAGNIRAAEILAAADRCLTPAPPMQARAVFLPEPEAPARERIFRRMPVGKTQFCIGFKSTPVSGTERLRDSLLTTLTLDLLIGPAAPLFQRLLCEGLLNDTFDTDCFAGDGWFTAIAEGESDDPEAVLDALCAEIARVQKEGADAEIFAVLKKAAYGDSIIGMNDPESVCTAMLDAFMWDCESPYERTRLLRELTVSDVQECLRKRFRTDRICLSVIAPEQTEI